MGKMESDVLREAMKEPAIAREVRALVYSAYLEHGTLGRAAVALGLKRSALDGLLHEYPALREARAEAWRVRQERGVRVVRWRQDPPKAPAEVAPVPPPPPPPRRRQRSAGGPPLAMELVVDVIQRMPPDPIGQDDEPSRADRGCQI